MFRTKQLDSDRYQITNLPWGGLLITALSVGFFGVVLFIVALLQNNTTLTCTKNGDKAQCKLSEKGVLLDDDEPRSLGIIQKAEVITIHKKRSNTNDSCRVYTRHFLALQGKNPKPTHVFQSHIYTNCVSGDPDELARQSEQLNRFFQQPTDTPLVFSQTKTFLAWLLVGLGFLFLLIAGVCLVFGLQRQRFLFDRMQGTLLFQEKQLGQSKQQTYSFDDITCIDQHTYYDSDNAPRSTLIIRFHNHEPLLVVKDSQRIARVEEIGETLRKKFQLTWDYEKESSRYD